MKKIVCLALFIAYVSCKTEKTEPSQMDQVMLVHDEVMPKIGKLNHLIKQLKPKADTTAQGKIYQTAMEDLQAAHTSMFDWMSDFSENMNVKEGEAEKKAWLSEEQIKVEALRDHINSSIATAEELLKK